MKWTGEIKNGLLEGQGDGYVIVKLKEHTASFAFEGIFRNGMMIKGYIMRRNDVFGNSGSEYHVELRPFSEGVAWMKDNTLWINGNPKYRYSLIDADRNIVIDRKYEDIKQDFIDGKAVVTEQGLDIVVDQRGKFYGIAEGMTEIPKEYFNKQPYRDSLKTITIPRSVTKIGNNAFQGCKSLISASVPSMITSKVMGKAIFADCDNLKAITVCNTNGTKNKDSNWYWYMAQEPNEKRLQELAAAEREKNAIENSDNFPRPDEDAEFSHVSGAIAVLSNSTCVYGEAIWRNPMLIVKIGRYLKGDYYFFEFLDYDGKYTDSPEYTNFTDCVAAAYFFHAMKKLRTKGLAPGAFWKEYLKKKYK